MNPNEELRDWIVLVSPIMRDVHIQLSELIKTKKQHRNCTVFLVTYGGDADAAYRIGRCLLHSYEHVRLVVPGFCKSAGTIICMAAHELAISDLGELGPLDVQILRKDEVGDRSSGLDLVEAIGLISNQLTTSFRNHLLSIKNETRLSTRLAGDFAVKLATSMVDPLYSQIDPIRLGEGQRAISIALQYGLRLTRKTGSITQDALLRLITGYPSHGFVIDRGEARELFKNVSSPTEKEERLCEALRKQNPAITTLDLVEEPIEEPNNHEQHSVTDKAQVQQGTPGPSVEQADKPAESQSECTESADLQNRASIRSRKKNQPNS